MRILTVDVVEAGCLYRFTFENGKSILVGDATDEYWAVANAIDALADKAS